MFFTFNSRKLINIGAILGLLIVCVVVSVFVNNRYKAGDAFDLYFRKFGENISYWWNGKVLGAGIVGSIAYQAGEGEARSVPVLVYHGLADEGGGENPYVSSKFAEHMRALNQAGWKTITLKEFEDFIRGRAKLPEKSFLLTFDDGRKDTFYPSDPVLRDLDMSAVMFAITKRSINPTEEQSPYYMSPYELNSMENSEHWEVESHGRDSHDWYYVEENGDIGHFFSNLLWHEAENRNETLDEYRERVSYDLSQAKSDLENALGKEVKAFAFPFGDYGQDGLNLASAEDLLEPEVAKYYDLAFYQVWNSGETFNYPSSNIVMMKRIEPLSEWSGEYLLNYVESGLSKDLPYEQTTFGEEWVDTWGTVVKGENLDMKATSITTGVSAGLNGSWWWSNYVFSADATWLRGSNIVLVARRSDDNNYYGCNFGRTKVYVKRVSNSNSTNLVGADYTAPAIGTTANLGVRVNGGSLECLVNGQVVIAVNSTSNQFLNGGIGIELWDERNGVSSATFDNISVTEI